MSEESAFADSDEESFSITFKGSDNIDISDETKGVDNAVGAETIEQSDGEVKDNEFGGNNMNDGHNETHESKKLKVDTSGQNISKELEFSMLHLFELGLKIKCRQDRVNELQNEVSVYSKLYDSVKQTICESENIETLGPSWDHELQHDISGLLNMRKTMKFSGEFGKILRTGYFVNVSIGSIVRFTEEGVSKFGIVKKKHAMGNDLFLVRVYKRDKSRQISRISYNEMEFSIL